jgi:hypothetical protein
LALNLRTEKDRFRRYENGAYEYAGNAFISGALIFLSIAVSGKRRQSDFYSGGTVRDLHPVPLDLFQTLFTFDYRPL